MTDFNKENIDVEYMFGKILSDPGLLSSIFGGMPGSFPEYESKPNPYHQLGNGYELRPIEILAEGGQFVVENRDKFSHLYHNDAKVSDVVFRKGGFGGEFKDGYCELIMYRQKEEHTKKRHGFDFGTFVIINQSGDIVMEGGSFSSEHPHHIRGHIASLGESIYDLRTGKAIAPKCSNPIKGLNYMIIEHRYNWNKKEDSLPIGVYQINYQTAEVIKIDDIKH